MVNVKKGYRCPWFINLSASSFLPCKFWIFREKHLRNISFSLIYLSIVPCHFSNIQACVSSPVKRKEKRKNWDFQNDSLQRCLNSEKELEQAGVIERHKFVKLARENFSISKKSRIQYGEGKRERERRMKQCYQFFNFLCIVSSDDITNKSFSYWEDNWVVELLSIRSLSIT